MELSQVKQGVSTSAFMVNGFVSFINEFAGKSSTAYPPLLLSISYTVLLNTLKDESSYKAYIDKQKELGAITDAIGARLSESRVTIQQQAKQELEAVAERIKQHIENKLTQLANQIEATQADNAQRIRMFIAQQHQYLNTAKSEVLGAIEKASKEMDDLSEAVKNALQI